MLNLDDLNAFGKEYLPGLLGIEVIEIGDKRVVMQLPIRKELLAPNGYLHAGAVVALADTACGYGVIANLPGGAQGFTTIELKTNFLGTAIQGVIVCEATLAHAGRTTQVWDARVTDPGSGRVLALFRCTQLIIYPRS